MALVRSLQLSNTGGNDHTANSFAKSTIHRSLILCTDFILPYTPGNNALWAKGLLTAMS
jgi:hypothetical protein